MRGGLSNEGGVDCVQVVDGEDKRVERKMYGGVFVEYSCITMGQNTEYRVPVK